MKIKWKGSIYNEMYVTWVKWHDYVSVIFNGFPIILVRRYDWLKSEAVSFSVFILGFRFEK
jgi:hypothetical protein